MNHGGKAVSNGCILKCRLGQEKKKNQQNSKIITSKTKDIGNLFKTFGKKPINTIFSSKLYWTVLAPRTKIFS